jgi:Ala-tRNA(Pro) deacylase
MSISAKIREYLDQQHVAYEHHEHPTAYTAQETASSMHLPGGDIAKTVVVKADGALILAVAPANQRVDLQHLKFITRAENIRIASETEFADAFPSCEPGAVPPFGNLFGLATYCDTRLESDTIEFNAGSHNDTLRMAFEDFKRLARPTMIDLVQHHSRHIA